MLVNSKSEKKGMMPGSIREKLIQTPPAIDYVSKLPHTHIEIRIMAVAVANKSLYFHCSPDENSAQKIVSFFAKLT